MNHILAAANVELLAQLAWSRVLLAFDFDGTLAPIVASRDQARMRARTRTLLEQVCHRYPCVVISGRGRQDVARRLSGLPLLHIIGNHGLEPGEHLPNFEHEIAEVRPQLAAALDGCSGVDIEDKRFSLAIHYRRSRRKKDARCAIHQAVARLTLPMRIGDGKLVVNVIPARAPHKGDALIHLRALEGTDTAIYVGDDETDEDVFELDQPGRLLSIRVGRSASTAARYYLRDQQEIDPLLAHMAKLRAQAPVP
jgi:trehalose 6-phosphate phosphatase